MQRVLRWALLCVFLALDVGCATRANFQEGIVNFRAQNYRTAFILLKPEAERGQPDAQYAVGYMYYYGQGVVENRRQAWIWINKAAMAGQPEAVIAAKLLTKGAMAAQKNMQGGIYKRRNLTR
ncbi:tetratricopeptide repeat protein [Legionella sp. CNM-4043-24]|uniref:tetratricopeptide repeat protein n=1 Tax=Legionella sp. CNM-4043-24 TaxID=3421646 RepID=UPI00403AB5BD